MGLWNTLVLQLWLTLGASPEIADAGTRLVALGVFGAWVAFERDRPGLGLEPPAGRRWLLQIAPLLAMVMALNLDQSTGISLSAFALVGAVLAAGWEELAFRGVLMSRLAPAGPTRAAWISSLGFGLLHGAQPDLASAGLSIFLTTGLGLALAALRVGTGSLWPPLAAHVLINVSAQLTLGATPAAQTGRLWIPLLLGAYFLGYGAFLLYAVRSERGEEEGLR